MNSKFFLAQIPSNHHSLMVYQHFAHEIPISGEIPVEIPAFSPRIFGPGRKNLRQRVVPLPPSKRRSGSRGLSRSWKFDESPRRIVVRVESMPYSFKKSLCILILCVYIYTHICRYIYVDVDVDVFVDVCMYISVEVDLIYIYIYMFIFV